VSDGPNFVKPTVGRTVHYFPAPAARSLAAGKWAGPLAAIITYVHERERDEATGEEIGTWVVSLTVLPPPIGHNRFGDDAPLLAYKCVPLEGFYDEGDVEKHPEWTGGWNWPPRVV